MTIAASLRRACQDSSRAWFRTLNATIEPALRAGLGSPLPLGAGAVVVETTGRRTGQPRRVPLLASRSGRRIVVSTVRTRSLWARNLEANAGARVWVGGRPRAATATVRRLPFVTVAVLDLDEA